MTDSVDLKRALETQRAKQLRLLAGWVVMLGVLSGGPLALPVPRWIRAFFETLLIRAEYAAQNLVRVSVCLQAAGGLVDPISAPRPCVGAFDDVPSAQALIRRMIALREVLENLSHHARRLLRVQKIAGAAFDFTASSQMVKMRGWLRPDSTDWTAPRIERPPDKESGLGLFSPELPSRCGREVFVLAA